MNDRWEYDFIEGPEGEIDKLVHALNAKGQEGWEAFTSFGIKKGITRDLMAILLRRRVAA